VIWAYFEPTFSQTGFFKKVTFKILSYFSYIKINLLNINIITLDERK